MDLQAEAAESYRAHLARCGDTVRESRVAVQRATAEVEAARDAAAAALERLRSARGSQLRSQRQLEREVKAQHESESRFAELGRSTAELRKRFADAMRVQQRNEDLAKRVRVIAESAIGVVESARERRGAEVAAHTQRCDAELVAVHRTLWRQLVLEETEARSDAGELATEVERRRKQRNGRLQQLMPWKALETERVALVEQADALHAEAKVIDLRAAPAYEALREAGVDALHPHAAVQAEIRRTYVESERALARQCLGESQLLRRLVESPTSVLAAADALGVGVSGCYSPVAAAPGTPSAAVVVAAVGPECGLESPSAALGTPPLLQGGGPALLNLSALVVTPRAPKSAMQLFDGAAGTEGTGTCMVGECLVDITLPHSLQIMTPPTQRAVGQWLERVALEAGSAATAAAKRAAECAAAAGGAARRAAKARADAADAGVDAARAAARAAVRCANETVAKVDELRTRNEETKRKGDLRVQELRAEAVNADRRRSALASLQVQAEAIVAEFRAEHSSGDPPRFMSELWRLLPGLLEPSAFADLALQRRRRKILGALHPDKVSSARERGEISPLDEAVASEAFLQIEAMTTNQ